jgi:hypothetical protein
MARRGFAHSSVNVPFDCDPDCVLHTKGETSSYGEFRNATEKQWQDAFAGAIADLAQGDWAQRLSEIHEEVCRNPDDVDQKRLNVLESEMFTKLRLEARSENIDEKALAHPNDASGVEAFKQLRVQSMKQAILNVKVKVVEHSCPSPAKAPGK